MTARLATLAIVAAVLAAGCEDEAATQLRVELAPSAGDLGGEGCRIATGVEPAALPVTVDHVFLRVCRYGAVGCEAVPLAKEGEDHGTATPGSLLELADRSFEVDGRLGSGEHRVEVVACEGTVPFARGVADRVRFDADGVRVRLYRFGRSSCAGPRRAGGGLALPRPRALHHAVPLPNGDVLVFGGVTGDAAPVPSGTAGMVSWEGLPLRREVVVYRPSEERFLEVRGEGFGRVLSAARLLPSSSANGPYRIRVVGGFEVEGDAAAVRFDASQGRTFYGAPLLPTDIATVADSVDLVYDPSGPSLSVEPRGIPGNPRAGANRAGDFAPDVPSAVVLGITAMDTGTADSPRPDVAGAYWWLGQDGMRVGSSEPLLSARFGHTVSTVPVASGALVWGGNVAESDLAVVQANAGELLVPGAAPTPVAGGGLTALPAPVALHTATTLFDDSVVIAGGLRVGCSGGTCGGALGFSTLYADPPLEVLRYEGGTFVRVPVDITTPVEQSFLHAAVPIGSGGRATAVALLGGASADGTTRLKPSDQIVRVTSTDVGRFGTTPLGSVPVDGLIHPRWGHTATPLGEDRLLVLGGLHYDGDGRVAAIPQAEMISYAEPPTPNPCAEVSPPDGGVDGLDGGSPPGDAGAPSTDGGVPPGDAGAPPTDGGSDSGI